MDLKKLTPEQYHITQECGTERPFTANTTIIMRMEIIIVFVVTKFCSNLKLNLTLGQVGQVFMTPRIRKILFS